MNPLPIMLGSTIFAIGLLIAGSLVGNRKFAVVFSVATTLIAALVAALGGGDTLMDKWFLFVVAFFMFGLGFYANAKWMYGNDYWKKK